MTCFFASKGSYILSLGDRHCYILFFHDEAQLPLLSGGAPIERVAQNYYRKDHLWYDRDLHNLQLNQCLRTATADGSNALFVVHKVEEKKLAEEGRVVKEKEHLSIASRVLD